MVKGGRGRWNGQFRHRRLVEAEPMVFVIDDDKSIRKGLARLLQSVGYNIEVFASGSDFLARAERKLARAGFDGVFQLASFHPQFQFAGTEADDLGNATNRAPYPTLHLLREDSVSRAVEAFPEAEAIFERNIDTLEALGSDGWVALDVGPGSARP